MSYDLTISSDPKFSSSTPFADLAAFLKASEGIATNGHRGFVYEPVPGRHMEIDLERVSEEGDNIEEPGGSYAEINCVRLHIPYAMLGNAPERDYFPMAFRIAERLNWTVYDDQSGQPLVVKSAAPVSRRPWWKLW